MGGMVWFDLLRRMLPFADYELWVKWAIQWSKGGWVGLLSLGCLSLGGLWAARRQWLRPKKRTSTNSTNNSNSTKQFIKSEVKINQLEFLFFAAVDEINKAKERNGLIDWTSGAPSSPAARQANNSTNQMLAFQLGPHLMVVLAELLLVFLLFSSLNFNQQSTLLLFFSKREKEKKWVELIGWGMKFVGYEPEAPLPRAHSIPANFICFHFSSLGHWWWNEEKRR